MPWVRFDDTFPIHRKVDGLSDAAFRLHVSAVFWCARNLTDGGVPGEDLDLVTARVRTPARFAAELVRRGLWHETGQVCDSEDCPADGTQADGWVIHDYFEYQPTKGKVVRERKANAERQKAWRERQKARSETEDNDVSNGDRNAVSNGVSNDAPSRPAPSSGGTGHQDTSPSVGGAGGKPRDKARGTRLPEPFEVSEAMKAWARENAPTCGPSDHERFLDYWRAQPGAKGRKTDWVATWRNWMRRADEDRGRASPRRASAQSTTSERVAGWLALADPPTEADVPALEEGSTWHE